MPRESAALLLRRHHWQLAKISDQSHLLNHTGVWHEEDVAQSAEVISNCLAEEGLANQPIALLLDADITFAANLTIESPAQLRKSAAMLYRLEEKLPLAAEDIAATYFRHHNEVLAVVAEKANVRPIAEALEQLGHAVEFVIPMMPLAIKSHVSEHSQCESEALIWLHDDGTSDCVVIKQGQPTYWHWLSDATTQLAQQLTCRSLADRSESPLHVYHNGLARESLHALLNQMPGAEVHVCDQPPLAQQSLDALAAILQGREEPYAVLPELAPSGAGVRSPLRFDLRLLQLAAFLFVAAIAYFNWTAACNYETSREELQIASEDVFRQVFPDARLTTGVRSRLDSELAKLSGARGDDSDSALSESVLPLTHDLLRSLPSNMRFRLHEIRMEGEELHLVGEVRDYSDADRIAAALRAQGLVVTAPTTQRLAKEGVAFRLVAERPESKGENNG